LAKRTAKVIILKVRETTEKENDMRNTSSLGHYEGGAGGPPAKQRKNRHEKGKRERDISSIVRFKGALKIRRKLGQKRHPMGKHLSRAATALTPVVSRKLKTRKGERGPLAAENFERITEKRIWNHKKNDPPGSFWGDDNGFLKKVKGRTHYGCSQTKRRTEEGARRERDLMQGRRQPLGEKKI